MRIAQHKRSIAILHCDIVEFSRLTAHNEDSTFYAVRNAFLQANDFVSNAHGEIINTAGDSFLAIFPTAQGAILASQNIQRYLSLISRTQPEDQRVRVRMGIHVGDALVEGEQALGNDVNIAARLQEIAPPGGIFISETAYAQINNEDKQRYKAMGRKLLRHITNPINAYLLRTGSEALEIADRLIKHEKPSILVLPFTTLKGHPELDDLGESLAIELIDALSRFRQVIILGPQTALSTQIVNTDTGSLAKKLGVRFVVKGVFHHNPRGIKISIQLLEMPTGQYVWSESINLNEKNLEILSGSISKKIVATLVNNIEVTIGQSSASQSDSVVYEQLLRARRFMYRMQKSADSQSARTVLEKILKNHGEVAAARSGLALSLLVEFLMGWSPDPEISLKLAFENAACALELDPMDSEAHAVFGITALWHRKHILAIHHLDRAILLNPNHADALAGRGLALVFRGQALNAFDQLQEALMHNPFSPTWYLWGLSISCYNIGRHQDVIDIIQTIPVLNRFHRRILAASYAQLGYRSLAATERALAMEEAPLYYVEDSRRAYPFEKPEYIEPLIEGLLAAGFPSRAAHQLSC